MEAELDAYLAYTALEPFDPWESDDRLVYEIFAGLVPPLES